MTRRQTVVVLRGNGSTRPPTRQYPPTPGSETTADLMGDDQIISPRQAAQVIGVANSTLQLWRSRGEGPKPFVINGKTRGYRLGAVRAWIRDHEKA